MKFLTDVNASGAVAAWLSHAGFDVAQVSTVDARMADEDILRWRPKFECGDRIDNDL